MTACDRCHRRKTRCDKRFPDCGSCAKSHVRCNYPGDLNHRQFQRDHLKSMEQRLRNLERENQHLRASNVTGSLPPSSADNGNHSSITAGSRNSDFAQSPAANIDTPLHDTIPRGTSTSEQEQDRQYSQATTVTPASHSRYLGSSVGAEFVDLVERVVDSPNPPGDMFAKVSDAYCKPAMPGPVTLPLLSIPDRGTAMQLISSYFGHWHLTFPLLYRPAFSQLVDSIYSEPSFCENNHHCAFVFNIVLALGSATSKRFEWSFKDTESYFTRAMSHFDEILSFRDIRTLQALLLCCQYGIHASLRDTADEMWDLLGKAERICVEIGLHQLRSSARNTKCDIHLTGPIPLSLQSEMQRRCFWCFYNLDRIVSITLGRPLTPSDDDIDTPLPSHLDDDTMESQLGSSLPDSYGTPAKLSPFLQLIHIRRILARIHRFFYTSVPTRSLSLQEKLAIRRNLMGELENWKNNIPSLGLSSHRETSSTLSAFASESWYEALYYSAVLLMFRPSGTFPHEERQVANRDEDVLRITWESSRSIITKYKEVLQARRLNYSWICLYTIFMAGLANVYSVGRSAQRRKVDRRSFLPDCADVMADIQDCSNILTAICERWDDARSSCEIFSRLSNSAFKELLNVQCSGNEMANASSHQTASSSVIMRGMGNDEPSAQFRSARGNAADSQQQHEVQFRFASPAPTGDQDQQLGDVLGFQHFFQDMQSSVYGGEFDGPNEVIMGLDRDWFS